MGASLVREMENGNKLINLNLLFFRFIKNISIFLAREKRSRR